MELQENSENHGGGVFAWNGKACGKAQMSTKRSLHQRKTEGGLGKGLVNLLRRKKITKKAYAGRGQETKWEMSIKYGYVYTVTRSCKAANSNTISQDS